MSMCCCYTGLPLFTNVLSPRVKAVQLCIETLRQSTDAIYDVTVAYSSTLPPTSSSAQQRLVAPTLAGRFMSLTFFIQIKKV